MYAYRRRLFAALQWMADVSSFALMWRLTVDLRIFLNALTHRHLAVQNAGDWTPSLALVIPLWAAVSLRFRLFRNPDEFSPGVLIRSAAGNTLAVLAVSVFATFFSHQFGAGVSRLFPLCLAPVAFASFVCTRCCVMLAVKSLQNCGRAPRIVIVGELSQATIFLNTLREGVARTICGIVVPFETREQTFGKLPVFGSIEKLAETVNEQQVEHALILNRSMSDAQVEHCSRICWRMGLPVSYAVNLPTDLPWRGDDQQAVFRFEITKKYGFPTIDVRSSASARVEDAAKRLFDVAGASVLLLLLGPLMGLVAVLLRMEGSGLILERSLHVGKGGRHFNCIRFRCCRERDETTTLTPVQEMFVRYRLQELPQILNVLRGRMSLVGPMPLSVPVHESAENEPAYSGRLPERLIVKPGLTGSWQVTSRRLSFEEMLRLDLEYVQTRSLALDLSILLLTPAKVLRGIRSPEAPSRDLHLAREAS